jgi:hypothetical protein
MTGPDLGSDHTRLKHSQASSSCSAGCLHHGDLGMASSCFSCIGIVGGGFGASACLLGGVGTSNGEVVFIGRYTGVGSIIDVAAIGVQEGVGVVGGTVVFVHDMIYCTLKLVVDEL